jgi:ribosomal protein L37AE/L43A|tara:strand:+ start:194 stop:730 length:537 start_codon:yes stop_codon:yes gene_type:complete
MAKNIEKIKGMLDGIIDPSNKRIRVGWVPGENETNVKLEDRAKRKEKSDIIASARMPLFCPKCDKIMKKHLDNKIWMLYDQCFDCQIEFENKLRVEGKYEEWEQEKIINNAKAYIQEVKNELDDYVEALKSDNILYETGQTTVEKEKWDKVDTNKVKTQWLKEIQEVEDNLEQYIGGN